MSRAGRPPRSAPSQLRKQQEMAEEGRAWCRQCGRSVEIDDAAAYEWGDQGMRYFHKGRCEERAFQSGGPES